MLKRLVSRRKSLAIPGVPAATAAAQTQLTPEKDDDVRPILPPPPHRNRSLPTPPEPQAAQITVKHFKTCQQGLLQALELFQAAVDQRGTSCSWNAGGNKAASHETLVTHSSTPQTINSIDSISVLVYSTFQNAVLAFADLVSICDQMIAGPRGASTADLIADKLVQISGYIDIIGKGIQNSICGSDGGSAQERACALHLIQISLSSLTSILVETRPDLMIGNFCLSSEPLHTSSSTAKNSLDRRFEQSLSSLSHIKHLHEFILTQLHHPTAEYSTSSSSTKQVGDTIHFNQQQHQQQLHYIHLIVQLSKSLISELTPWHYSLYTIKSLMQKQAKSIHTLQFTLVETDKKVNQLESQLSSMQQTLHNIIEENAILKRTIAVGMMTQKQQHPHTEASSIFRTDLDVIIDHLIERNILPNMDYSGGEEMNVEEFHLAPATSSTSYSSSSSHHQPPLLSDICQTGYAFYPALDVDYENGDNEEMELLNRRPLSSKRSTLILRQANQVENLIDIVDTSVKRSRSVSMEMIGGGSGGSSAFPLRSKSVKFNLPCSQQSQVSNQPTILSCVCKLQGKIVKVNIILLCHHLTFYDRYYTTALYRGRMARCFVLKHKRRLSIIEEMLNTEVNYLQGLVDIHKDFMIPLQQLELINEPKSSSRQHMSLYSPLSASSSSVTTALTSQEYYFLFASLDVIMQLHSRFLSLLHERISRCGFTVHLGIGDVLSASLFAGDQLGIYSSFIGRYKLLLKTYEKLKTRPAFHQIQMVNKEI